VIPNGGTATCTITNDDIAPKLTVIKYLVPSTDPGKFNLLIDGVVKASNVGHNGTTGAVATNAGLRTVSETAGTGTSLGNYLATIGGDCAADGTITLAVGDEKTCTITNKLVKISLDKQIGLSATGPWYSSLSSVLPGTDVYYRFVVTNTGGVDLTNVSVNDPMLGGTVCTVPGTLAVGASYTCAVGDPYKAAYNDNTSTCNTATATGTAGAKTATATDTACYSSDYWAFTPGFWKTHWDAPKQNDAWQYTAYEVGNSLAEAGFVTNYVNENATTLLDALSLPGGRGEAGAERTLLRAAVAALLNASFHETTTCFDDDGNLRCSFTNDMIIGPNGQVFYPYTTEKILELFNAETAKAAMPGVDNRSGMLELAMELDAYNNGNHYINWNDPNQLPPPSGSTVSALSVAYRREAR
jgi:uncharacterized repeat protein (TIGR01451 family)